MKKGKGFLKKEKNFFPSSDSFGLKAHGHGSKVPWSCAKVKIRMAFASHPCFFIIFVHGKQTFKDEKTSS